MPPFSLQTVRMPPGCAFRGLLLPHGRPVRIAMTSRSEAETALA